ncbi:hypothetical protein BRYFOR_06814 [Marvinbryantia formatexigens DSM 14469]|uniref:Uncharacterized protein n=1 Tax=Marvinbryantia formatexigens DSM 14469 TaxID=478749 RepID=C6LDW5_9FIRM|nr:hypothetical protein BRYFOR_06814 [Marvinbryantia formatexigens DSM 14469]
MAYHAFFRHKMQSNNKKPDVFTDYIWLFLKSDLNVPNTFTPAA